MKVWHFSFILLVCIFYSCGSEDVTLDEVDFGYDYVPVLPVGDIREYEIDLTVFANDGLDVTQQIYYQQEEITESEGKSGERASFRKQISTSQTGRAPWNPTEQQLIETNELQVIQNTEYDRLVVLSFPILSDKIWDGLALFGGEPMRNFKGEDINFYKNWEFRILETDGTFEDFNNVITVQHADYENDLEKRYVIEKYADNIGLVYREQIILDTQCISDCIGMTWTEKAHNGIILKQKLIKLN